jgi:hypothetical protein
MKVKLDKALILEANYHHMQQVQAQRAAGIPQSTTSKVANVAIPVGILGGAAYGINKLSGELVKTLDPGAA